MMKASLHTTAFRNEVKLRLLLLYYASAETEITLQQRSDLSGIASFEKEETVRVAWISKDLPGIRKIWMHTITFGML
eukprot:5153328-Amphidinium_carterae.2